MDQLLIIKALKQYWDGFYFIPALIHNKSYQWQLLAILYPQRKLVLFAPREICMNNKHLTLFAWIRYAAVVLCHAVSALPKLTKYFEPYSVSQGSGTQ